MQRHRYVQQNLLEVDRVIAWVESSKSELLWIDGNNMIRQHDFNTLFADPLLNLGESNCESYLVLRHFCGDRYSVTRTSYRTLIQSLLSQIFKHRPKVWKNKAGLLTNREPVDDINRLWDPFVDCLRDVQVDCIFIVINSIDFLKQKEVTPAVQTTERSF